MSYIKAMKVLPKDLLRSIQEYIDGEYIYIPKKENNKKEWGSNTTIRKELENRNKAIYIDYEAGYKLEYLANKYYLSLKSIQRIVLQERKK